MPRGVRLRSNAKTLSRHCWCVALLRFLVGKRAPWKAGVTRIPPQMAPSCLDTVYRVALGFLTRDFRFFRPGVSSTGVSSTGVTIRQQAFTFLVKFNSSSEDNFSKWTGTHSRKRSLHFFNPHVVGMPPPRCPMILRIFNCALRS
jgi:hypothetical protein